MIKLDYNLFDIPNSVYFETNSQKIAFISTMEKTVWINPFFEITAIYDSMLDAHKKYFKEKIV